MTYKCDTGKNKMIIQSSDKLKHEYNCISTLVHETGELIYITKSDEGDDAFTSLDSFEEREKNLQIRAKVLQAELERLTGTKEYSKEEVSKILENDLNAF